MTLLALGINHNTASLRIREQVAFAPEQMAAALLSARAEARLQEVAILSTCNRTEIYATLAEGVDAQGLLQWLASYHQLPEQDLQACHYWLRGEDAIGHMMKVACGLDSLVLGEPQILGQMKSAYAVARNAETVRAGLHRAFQQVFAIAKRVRTETAIGENPVSVAYAAVSLAQQIFAELEQETALLIGAGETIELVARHLCEQGVKKLIVANRTLQRANDLASEFGAEAILLADIPQHLPRADIVISSTASQLPLLGKGAVETALKQRKHRPMFMVDIAVPRDIESQVGELDDVYLYTVDDLSEVIDENRKSREEAARKASLIVAEGVCLYQQGLRAQGAVGTIKAYRQQAEGLRDAELARALRSLDSGAEPAQVMQQLARGLTNKLLHGPTASLTRAGAEGRESLLAAAGEIFDLAEDDLLSTSACATKSEKT